MNPRIVAFALLTSVACQRAANSPPPPPPPSVDHPVAAPPVVAQPPSADGLVLTPGEGLGPYSLGMSREAVRALAGDTPAGEQVEVDGVTLRFGADGAVTSVTAKLARTEGGVRVGASVLPNNATYAEVVAAVGPCEAPQANIGATVTRCQSGGITVVQAGPSQELSLGVARTP